MRLQISVVVTFGFLCLVHCGLIAQQSDLRSDFEFAAAEAHAKTSLFASSQQPPFKISAEVESFLALRGSGKGTFEEQRVSHGHWRRVIHFDDYESVELSTDSRGFWRAATGPRPIRAYELFRLALFHVPGSANIQSFQMDRSFTATEDGHSVRCYAAHKNSPDSFPRRYQWCFDSITGLLTSEDLPLKTHVAFRDYVTFQGKARVHSGTCDSRWPARLDYSSSLLVP